jgi:hypothetical protein
VPAPEFQDKDASVGHRFQHVAESVGCLVRGDAARRILASNKEGAIAGLGSAPSFRSFERWDVWPPTPVIEGRRIERQVVVVEHLAGGARRCLSTAVCTIRSTTSPHYAASPVIACSRHFLSIRPCAAVARPVLFVTRFRIAPDDLDHAPSRFIADHRAP